MSPFYSQLFAYSGVIAIAVGIGGVLPLTIPFMRRHLPALLSFSAGVMLGAAALHLLPEAFEFIPKSAGLWILLGFLFLFLFEKFVTVHICEAMDCAVHHIGISAFVGLSLHALTEGIALGTGLLTADMGWIVFLSICLHKLPAALALTAVLIHENYRQRTIALLQTLFFIMVPVGAMAIQLVSQGAGKYFLGAAIGFSAGTFLHISLSDLLPEVHRSGYHKVLALVTFLIGLLIMVFVRYGSGH